MRVPVPYKIPIPLVLMADVSLMLPELLDLSMAYASVRIPLKASALSEGRRRPQKPKRFALQSL